MEYLVFAVFGYVSGSVMYSRLLPFLFKQVDITKISDDGNPGAGNVFQHLGISFIPCHSVGTIISSFVGTSTVASYVESASGIAQGGRTGLTAITVAGLFALALLFSPIISLVPACATAPALVIVGAIMMSDVRHINFTDFTEGFPAFLTIIMMPMTYSIASGIGFAFISYPLIKLLTGRARDLNICTWVIALLFLINFIILS